MKLAFERTSNLYLVIEKVSPWLVLPYRIITKKHHRKIKQICGQQNCKGCQRALGLLVKLNGSQRAHQGSSLAECKAHRHHKGWGRDLAAWMLLCPWLPHRFEPSIKKLQRLDEASDECSIPYKIMDTTSKVNPFLKHIETLSLLSTKSKP